MKIEDIKVRHWIVSEKLKHCIGRSWVKDAYKPPVGTMYQLPIKESIHYIALIQEDFSDYKELIRSTRQSEHSLDKFMDLSDKLNVDMLAQENHQIKINTDGIVQDGVHRLSILLKKQIIKTEIPDIWIKKVG